MTNDESVLREVDQGLAEDRQLEFIRRQGPILISAAAAVVFAVGGWQIWNAQKQSASEKSSVEFREAVEALSANAETGRAALRAFGAEAPGGYRVLSALRRAASLAQGGERLSALEAYRAVYADPAAPQRIKQLARLRAGLLSLDDGRDAVLADVGDLENDPSVFGFYARELLGVAAIDAGDFETAKSIFDRLSLAPEAPEALRQRAEEFAALASAGKAGASLTTEIQLDDLSTALGAEEDAVIETEAAAPNAELSVPAPTAVDDGTTDDQPGASEEQEPNE